MFLCLPVSAAAPEGMLESRTRGVCVRVTPFHFTAGGDFEGHCKAGRASQGRQASTRTGWQQGPDLGRWENAQAEHPEALKKQA
jgi:hypothetical protein